MDRDRLKRLILREIRRDKKFADKILKALIKRNGKIVTTSYLDKALAKQSKEFDKKLIKLRIEFNQMLVKQSQEFDEKLIKLRQELSKEFDEKLIKSVEEIKEHIKGLVR